MIPSILLSYLNKCVLFVSECTFFLLWLLVLFLSVSILSIDQTEYAGHFIYSHYFMTPPTKKLAFTASVFPINQISLLVIFNHLQLHILVRSLS